MVGAILAANLTAVLGTGVAATASSGLAVVSEGGCVASASVDPGLQVVPLSSPIPPSQPVFNFQGAARTLPPDFVARLRDVSGQETGLWADFRASERPHVVMITNHGYAGPRFPNTIDSGGQIVYVNAKARELAARGFKVTVVSRSFDTEKFPPSGPRTRPKQHPRRVFSFMPETGGQVRYLYVPGGLDRFVRKEEIYSELPDIGENLAAFLEAESVDPWDGIAFVDSHYVDGGVVGQHLVRSWQNTILRRHLMATFSEVLPHNFAEDRQDSLRNLPLFFGEAILRRWQDDSGARFIKREDVLRWLAGRLDISETDLQSGIEQILGSVNLHLVDKYFPTAVGAVLLQRFLNLDALAKDLDRVNRHAWTPHSIGTLKQKNLFASQETAHKGPEERAREWAAMNFGVRDAFERGLVGIGSVELTGAALLSGVSTLPSATALVATSLEISRELLALGGSPKKSGSQLYVPPGVNAGRNYPRDSIYHPDVQAFFQDAVKRGALPLDVAQRLLSRPQDFNLVVESSRMDETKRKHILVRAMKHLPENVLLFITGSEDHGGVYRGLRALIDEFGLQDRVFLLGKVPDEVMGGIEGLPQGDRFDQFRLVIAASASRMEGWGMAVQEMSSGGYPLVTSNMVPFASSLERAYPGAVQIVPLNGEDGADYAAAIRRLLDDPEHAREMGRNGRRFASTFEWPELTRGFLSDLDRIFERRSLPRFPTPDQPEDTATRLARVAVTRKTPYVVILGGGTGSRLAEFIRQISPDTIVAPKQFQHLTDPEKSMLQITAARFLEVESRGGVFPIPPDHLFVVTAQDQVGRVAEDLPEVPAQNILGEPHRRNTGPAIASAVHHIYRMDRGAQVLVVAADHHIHPVEGFLGNLEVVLAAMSERDLLMTLGIQATSPHTGYGWISPTQDSPVIAHPEVRGVAAFHEKPDRDQAVDYQHRGWFWNSGMFGFGAEMFLREIARLHPEAFSLLMGAFHGLMPQGDAMARFFSEVATSPIDRMLMEPAASDGHVAVVPVHDFVWSDVGGPEALAALVRDGAVIPPFAIRRGLVDQSYLSP